MSAFVVAVALPPRALALGLAVAVRVAAELGLGLRVRAVQQNLAVHVVSNLDTKKT